MENQRLELLLKSPSLPSDLDRIVTEIPKVPAAFAAIGMIPAMTRINNSIFFIILNLIIKTGESAKADSPVYFFLWVCI